MAEVPCDVWTSRSLVLLKLVWRIKDYGLLGKSTMADS
jgi:hypothetical protein